MVFITGFLFSHCCCLMSCRFVDIHGTTGTEANHHPRTLCPFTNLMLPNNTQGLNFRKNTQSPSTHHNDRLLALHPVQIPENCQRSLQRAAWCTIGIESHTTTNPWPRRCRAKALWGAFIKRAVEYPLKSKSFEVVVLFFCCHCQFCWGRLLQDISYLGGFI